MPHSPDAGHVRRDLAQRANLPSRAWARRAWIYAVARNAIAHRARARVDAVADVSDSPTDEPGPAEHDEHEWVRSRVHSAVEALPPFERSLIELAYWSDLSQSQIAARLGMPLGPVKTGTRRALASLATLLDRESQLAD